MLNDYYTLPGRHKQKTAAEPMGATAVFLMRRSGLLVQLLEQFGYSSLNLAVTTRDYVLRRVVNLDVRVELPVLECMTVAVQRGHLRDAEDE